MIKVVKNNIVMKLRDDNQLVAFINNGWQILEQEKTDTLQHNYTKSDINRMAIAELHELASSVGIDNSINKKGIELKKILIDYFNLNKD